MSKLPKDLENDPQIQLAGSEASGFLLFSSSIKDPSTQSEITAEPQEETLTSSTEHTTKPEENPATSQLQTVSFDQYCH